MVKIKNYLNYVNVIILTFLQFTWDKFSMLFSYSKSRKQKQVFLLIE